MVTSPSATFSDFSRSPRHSCRFWQSASSLADMTHSRVGLVQRAMVLVRRILFCNCIRP
ncbi:MAG TPA: hypothetical protein DHV85_03495 [Candidatus Accumulibacter sp.]|nr:hypothetical protein [Accumulibacter sp.]